MNAFSQTSCDKHSDAVMLVAFGDVAPDDLPPEVGEHLAVCAACRVELAEQRRMADALSDATELEPISPGLAARIVTEATRYSVRRERVRHAQGTAWMQGAGFAAAAMLLLGCLLPWNGNMRVATAGGLSEAEQLDLLAAYASLQWDGPLEYSIERIDDVLADVSQRLDALADELEQSPLTPDDAAPDGDDAPSLDQLPAQSSIGAAYCSATSGKHPIGMQR